MVRAGHEAYIVSTGKVELLCQEVETMKKIRAMKQNVATNCNHWAAGYIAGIEEAISLLIGIKPTTLDAEVGSTQKNTHEL